MKPEAKGYFKNKKEINLLSKIEIKNFEALDNILIDFADSPIISLVGTNGSGKTAVMKAIRTLFINENPNKQLRKVRTGTSGFGVRATDSHGNYIEKIKYAKGVNGGGSVYSAKIDGEIYQTASVTGIPDFIKDFTRIEPEKETKQVLQFRDHRTKLIFAETEASSNYRMFYNILNLQEITTASTIGVEKLNELKADLKGLESERDRLNEKQGDLLSKKMDLEPLNILRERLSGLMEIYSKLEVVNGEYQRYSKFHLDNSIFTLKEISESDVKNLENLVELIHQIEKLNQLKEQNERAITLMSIKEISDRTLTNLDRFHSVLGDAKRKEEILNNNQQLQVVMDLKEIESYEHLTKLQDILLLQNKLNEYYGVSKESYIENIDALFNLEEQDIEKFNLFSELISLLNKKELLLENIPNGLLGLEEINENLLAVFDDVLNLEFKLFENYSLLNSLKDELNELQETAPKITCPNCGYLFDFEDINTN